MIHNGVFTISNAEGAHRTFRIRTQKPDASFRPGERIVALLSGPDNGRDYQGFGFAHDDGITVWQKKRGQGKQSAFDWYAFLLKKGCEALIGKDGAEASAGFNVGGRDYFIQVSRTCLRCNKRLTRPSSVLLGYGPECAGKVGLAS